MAKLSDLLSQNNPSLSIKVTVANQNERFALTNAIVQNGDFVYQTSTSTLFEVIDDAALTSGTGYRTFATVSLAQISDATANGRSLMALTYSQMTDALVDGTTTNRVFTAAEKTKLSGIATGATANQSDANLLARTNHTGTQARNTLTTSTPTLTAVTLSGSVELAWTEATSLQKGTMQGATTITNITGGIEGAKFEFWVKGHTASNFVLKIIGTTGSLLAVGTDSATDLVSAGGGKTITANKTWIFQFAYIVSGTTGWFVTGVKGGY